MTTPDQAAHAIDAALLACWPGKPEDLSARTPLRLDGEPGIILLTRGCINVFCVDPLPSGNEARHDELCGRRHFLLQIAPGEILLGIPAVDGRAVIAVPVQGTSILRSADAQAQLATLPGELAETLYQRWWQHLGLAAGMASETPAPSATLATQSAEASRLIAARIHRESAGRRENLANIWDETRQDVANGLGQLARVLQASPLADDEAADDTQESPLVRVLRRVTDAARIELTLPPEQHRATDPDALLAALELRSRRVLLRNKWWQQENGPLLGMRENGQPVALLPTPRGRGYMLFDPDKNEQQAIDEELANTLQQEATMLYRQLPDRPLNARDLWAFARAGIAADSRLMSLMGMAAAALAMLTPIATGMLIESIIPRAAYFQHWQLIAALLAAAIGAAGFELTKGFAMLRIEGRIDAGLQAALFDRLLRLPTGFFKQYTAGDLGDRTLGVQTIRETLSTTVVTAILAGLFSLTSLLTMFWFSWKLGLIGLAIVLVVLGFSAWLGAHQLRQEREQIRYQGRVEGLVLQFITGIAKLHAAAAEARAFAVWARLYQKQKQRFANAQRAANVQELVQTCIPILASMLIFACMVWLLERSAIDLKLESLANTTSTLVRPDEEPDKVLSAGDMLAFNAAFGQFLQAMIGMTLALTKALGVMPMFERLRPLLRQLPESGKHLQAPGKLKGSIEFSEVSFRYIPESSPLLERISLKIEPGQFVAIVGPSGSGKSTLMRLMMGFEIPERGEILFDEKPLGGLDLTALRRAIGIVLQNGRIAAGSVFSNIAGNARITHDEAMEAARQAGLDTDIEALPMGLHTVLQEGGSTLSGGQRQRLLLARALVRKPAILLLDEATSALDNETQSIVMQRLNQLAVTRVVIAHRLSTIRNADQIIVINDGKIVEQGQFDALMSANGCFADLARRQLL